MHQAAKACPDEEFAEFFKDCKQSLSRPTKFSAPSKNCANYNHCNPGHGAPSRRALQRFLQTSNIVMPSSPRRVAAKLTGGVLNIAQQLYTALSVASGRELPQSPAVTAPSI